MISKKVKNKRKKKNCKNKNSVLTQEILAAYEITHLEENFEKSET